MRHPLPPRFAGLCKSVYEQHAFRTRPRIGVVVYRVEQLAILELEVRHRASDDMTGSTAYPPETSLPFCTVEFYYTYGSTRASGLTPAHNRRWVYELNQELFRTGVLIARDATSLPKGES